MVRVGIHATPVKVTASLGEEGSSHDDEGRCVASGCHEELMIRSESFQADATPESNIPNNRRPSSDIRRTSNMMTGAWCSPRLHKDCPQIL